MQGALRKMSPTAYMAPPNDCAVLLVKLALNPAVRYIWLLPSMLNAAPWSAILLSNIRCPPRMTFEPDNSKMEP